MSVETIHHISPSNIAETTPVHEQPPDKPDATILPQQERDGDRRRSVLYLSSEAIMANERALLTDMQAEALALIEEIRQADIALARIRIDLHFVDQQISDLGRAGVPQMTMQKNLEEAYQVTSAHKASLATLHGAKIEEISALKAHQDRREWSMSEDY